MLRLTCGKCRAKLEIDDAFAGGVCRCKHCGAIQAVPKKASPSPSTPRPNRTPRLLRPPSPPSI